MKPGQDRIVSHTDAEWSALNPVLADGEIGINRDGGRLKYGDGLTPWAGLPYLDESYARSVEVAQVAASVAAVSTVADDADRVTKGLDARVSALQAKVDALSTTVAIGPTP